ncbi:MAG: hypothetical protein AAFV19_12650 [Pseudomonadota bacterium]
MNFQSAPEYFGLGALEPGTAAMGIGAFALSAVVLYYMDKDMAMYAVIAGILGAFLIA